MTARSVGFVIGGGASVIALVCYCIAFTLVLQFYELYASWAKWFAIGGTACVAVAACGAIYGIATVLKQKRH